jgi:hypothetical protein
VHCGMAISDRLSVSLFSVVEDCEERVNILSSLYPTGLQGLFHTRFSVRHDIWAWRRLTASIPLASDIRRKSQAHLVL